MITFNEDVLKSLQQIVVLFWRSQKISGLRIYSKGNIEIGLFAIRYQRYLRKYKSNHNNWIKQNQITNIMEMKICIYQTMVEFGPLAKTFNEKKLK